MNGAAVNNKCQYRDSGLRLRSGQNDGRKSNEEPGAEALFPLAFIRGAEAPRSLRNGKNHSIAMNGAHGDRDGERELDCRAAIHPEGRDMKINRRRMVGWMGLAGGAALGAGWLEAGKAFTGEALGQALAASADTAAGQ